MSDVCAEVREDDGIPPHVLKKRETRAKGTRKTGATAYQHAVRRCLDAALASVCADRRFANLSVRSVEPLGRGTKLLVLVVFPAWERLEPSELEAALNGAGGLLRSVIAGEVPRKHTPALRFRVLPEEPGNV